MNRYKIEQYIQPSEYVVSALRKGFSPDGIEFACTNATGGWCKTVTMRNTRQIGGVSVWEGICLTCQQEYRCFVQMNPSATRDSEIVVEVLEYMRSRLTEEYPAVTSWEINGRVIPVEDNGRWLEVNVSACVGERQASATYPLNRGRGLAIIKGQFSFLRWEMLRKAEQVMESIGVDIVHRLLEG
jgi:hypothetical protein